MSQKIAGRRGRGSFKQQREGNERVGYQLDNQDIEMEDLGQKDMYKKQGLGGYDGEVTLDS